MLAVVVELIMTAEHSELYWTLGVNCRCGGEHDSWPYNHRSLICVRDGDEFLVLMAIGMYLISIWCDCGTTGFVH